MTNEKRTKFFSIFAEAAYDQGSSIKMENYIKEKYPSADKIAVIDKTPDDGGSGLYTLNGNELSGKEKNVNHYNYPLSPSIYTYYLDRFLL